MVETIKRTIHFYKITLKKEGEDIALSSIFSPINSYPIDSEERYYQLEDGNQLSMYISSQVVPIKAMIGTKRVTGLPSIEIRGVTSPLSIPDDAGLYEPTHFMIFDHNILASEFNFYGPRITSLRTYLYAKLREIVDEIEILPLMNQEFTTIVSNVGNIRKFRLKIHRDGIQLTRDLDANLYSTFEAARNVSDSEDIEITFSARKYSRDDIDIPFFRRLAGWLSTLGVKEQIETLKINAMDTITNEMKEFDLLEEFIVAKKDVVKVDDIHRSVSSDDMYRVIQESYNELRPTINRIIRT